MQNYLKKISIMWNVKSLVQDLNSSEYTFTVKSSSFSDNSV